MSDAGASAQGPRVTVRLYGGLLGDCFLLKFHGADPSTMLIDFGVLQNMAEGEGRLTAIAADIRKETGGKLDIIVVTHRHWDHVCGFNGKHDPADSVGEVWMSWIEDPKDVQGRQLLGQMQETGAALAGAVTAAGLAGGDTLSDLMDFLGPVDGGPAAAGRVTTARCVQNVKDLAPDRVRFLEPGKGAPIGTGGPIAWVLGPPRDESRLRDQEPSADKHEVYPLAAMLAADADAALANGKPVTFPFDVGLASEQGSSGWLDEIYYKTDAWRGIDASEGVTPLALSFDRIVNNTSLVLAIELAPGGDVLLFTADAQVGNWESWQDIKWPEGEERKTEDLLGRTVFLKVGHHGSINATVKDGGLEAMTSKNLCAFIPVVEQFARTKPRPWDMPHGPTLARLTEKTNGRVARGDQEAPPTGGARGVLRSVAAPADLPGASPFYVEYEI